MANIAPNSTVILLHGVPLAPDYEMSLYFGAHTTDASAKNACLERQANVMSAQALRLPNGNNAIFNELTYQRVGRNKIRVEAKADWLYNCNYLMFKNTDFGSNKWFYAFVTSVEYINNSVCEITYELDVIQTWFYDYNPQACFIERQHTPSDELYGNLVEENLGFDPEYLTMTEFSSDYFFTNDPNGTDYMRLCMLTSDLPSAVRDIVEPDYGKPLSALTEVRNIYSGLNVIVSGAPGTPFGGRSSSTINATAYMYVDGDKTALVSSDGTTAITFLEVLESMVTEGKEDAIVAIFPYPAFCEDSRTNDPIVNLPSPSTLGAGFNMGGYSPVNNKTKIYPYVYLECYNNNDQAMKYRYEDFRTANESGVFIRRPPSFRITGTFLNSPSMIAMPISYLGQGSNKQMAVTFDDFPYVSWTGDVFAAWMAVNKNRQILSVLPNMGTITNAAAAAGTGLAVGGPVGALAAGGSSLLLGSVTNAASSVANILATSADLKNAPAHAHGTTSASALTYAIDRAGFSFMCKTIKPEWAKIIDDYFTRYGYAIHDVAVPNEAARPYFTYVKTVGMSMYSDLPADDAAKIAAIYDKGITFWNCVRDTAHIGDYSMNNRPGI